MDDASDVKVDEEHSSKRRKDMMGMEEGSVTGGATLPPCEKT